MLIALLGAWFLMAGPDADAAASAWLLQHADRTRAEVARVVTEPQRRDDVLRTIEQMQAVDREHVARGKAAQAQVRAAAASRGTPSADLVAQLDALEAESRAAADKLIDLRFATKDRMTREEWQAVFNPGK